MALDDRGYSRDDAYPESRFMPDVAARKRQVTLRGYAALGMLVAGALATSALILKRRGDGGGGK